MAHANARLNLHGRRLLVERVIRHGRPVAHVAKELGISRQCAHRWVARYRCEGEAGLVERSSRPHRCPRRTSAQVEQQILELRRVGRRGQDWIGPELGVAPRTVSAVLRRHQVPYLRECDPLTGQVIRASKTTATRYEHDHPGSLIHMDVKKVGRIHSGGGWKAHGRQMGSTGAKKRARIGFDYVIGKRPGFLDGRPGMWWTVNGGLYPDVPMYMVSEGDVVVFRLVNESDDAHPMHLHGHHAVVLSRNGVAATGSPWVVDSLEVGVSETYEIAFVADNPGLWMDHCHNLPHASEGLVAHLMYDDVHSSFLVGGDRGNEPE